MVYQLKHKNQNSNVCATYPELLQTMEVSDTSQSLFGKLRMTGVNVNVILNANEQ